MCDEAAALRVLFGLMVQWKNEDRLCSGRVFFFSGSHVFEFYKAYCSAVQIDSFSGSTWQFLTVNSQQASFGLSWHSDWIILDTTVHSYKYSLSLSSYQVVTAAILWHTVTISLKSTHLSVCMAKASGFSRRNSPCFFNQSTCQRKLKYNKPSKCLCYSELPVVTWFMSRKWITWLP